MKLKILRDEFEPIKIEEIESFENKIGYRLPIDYKNFLLKNNGGICRDNEINFKELNDSYNEGVAEETTNFCSHCNIFHTSSNHRYFERSTSFHEVISLRQLNEIFEITKDEYNPNRKFIIIMLSSGGSEGAYLSLNTKTYGHIYFSDQTHESNFIHLANNLEDFINSFHESTEYEYNFDESAKGKADLKSIISNENLSDLTILKENYEFVNIENIQSFENKIGYKLPTEYKEFLLENNGSLCKADQLKFKVPSKYTNEKVVDFSDVVFFEYIEEFAKIISLKELDSIYEVIEDEYNPKRKYIKFIKGLYSGRGLYLSLNEETYGQIYYSNEGSECVFIHLGNSIKDVLNKFESYPY